MDRDSFIISYSENYSSEEYMEAGNPDIPIKTNKYLLDLNMNLKVKS